MMKMLGANNSSQEVFPNGGFEKERKISYGRILRQSVSDGTFTCGCCYELMVEPTTLNCGHSFCRICLAKWWKSSGKTTCPGCRQPWKGFPRVNIILRNSMQKLFTAELFERQKALLDSGAEQILKDFESKGEEMQNADAQGLQKPASWLREGFFYGVVTTLSIVFIFQAISNWGNSDYDLLVYKPLSSWKATDVAQWLTELGSWAAPAYSKSFLEAGINGYLLMGLENESQLGEDPFLISNALHRKAIFSALERIKEGGGKPPRDLWEYRALHRGLSLFLSYTVREFPRLTISGMYMFYYEDIFLPFIQVTCPKHRLGEENIHSLVYDDSSITKEQWVEFLPKFIFLPYYLFAEFAWEYLDVNFVTCSLVIANCALLTMIELKALRETWRRGLGPAVWALKKQTNTVLILFFSYIFWPLIPLIVCDLIFYISMYYSVCINFFEVFLQ